MRENKVRTNTHQVHFESLVLEGHAGLDETIDKICAFNRHDISITRKIDGAPAVIIGHGIEGYPEKCVGIKSFLTKPQNALSSYEEIDAKYGSKPNVARCLKHALDLADHIPYGEAWQGDCLFTEETLKERTIDGQTYMTFQPNKIIYAYDKVEGNFGIVFHTVYHRQDNSWIQSFDAVQPEIEDVFTMPIKVDYIPTAVDFSELEALCMQLKNCSAYQILCENRAFRKGWSLYENQAASVAAWIPESPETFVGWVACRYASAGKTKDLLDFLYSMSTENSFETIKLMLKVFNEATRVKYRMMDQLHQQNDCKQVMRRLSTGEYSYILGEGFSMSDSYGNIVKLVDRPVFSHMNRDQDIESGFAH